MSAFIGIAILYFLALISPGPDFAIVTRNSLVYSRKSGVFTSLGIACGTWIHIIYSLLGIGLIISQSIFLFNIIKLFGAGYLIFIGIQALLSKKHAAIKEEIITASNTDLGALKSVRMGFLCSALNPKTTLFFLVLFTQIIDPTTPIFVQILYGVYMSAITFTWFGLVSTIMSHNSLKIVLKKIQLYIERAIGAVLIVLGIKLAFSSSK